MLSSFRRHHLPLAVAAVVLAVLTTTLAGSPGRAAVAAGTCGSPRASLDGEEQAAVAMVNLYRAEQGLSQLRLAPVLSGIGAWMLDDIAASGRVEHTDSLGRSAYARAVACGYGGGAGENLAAGSEWDSALDALAAWKASPGHNANLLNRYYTEIGVARLYRPGSAYGWYWALEFGSNGPAAASPGSSPPAVPSASTQPRPTPPSTPTATPSPSPIVTPSAAAPPAASPLAPKPAGVSAQGASPLGEDPAAGPNRPWRLFLPGL